jgi:hypothetical protein
MRRAPGAVLGAAAALALSACAAPATREGPEVFPEGLYGNVRYRPESGDLAGFEVRFYSEPGSGRRMAEFTLCEGWCNAAYTATVVPVPGGFAFSHREIIDAGAGALVAFRVTRAGRALELSMARDGEDMTGGSPWRLRPLEAPYGLAVARGEGGAAVP